MKQNQYDKKSCPPHYTPAAWAAKCDIMAHIHRVPRRQLPPDAPRNPYLEAHSLPPELLRDLVMTPKQAEGVDVVQRLCEQVRRAVTQINTTIVTHELPLSPLAMVELGHLLLQADECIIGARCAARRLGIRAVQPKMRLALPQESSAKRKAA